MTRIRHTIMAAILAISGGALLSPHSASATSFCPLKETRDGFVALRNGPSPSAKLIGRMKAEDEVQIGQGRKGDWIEVIWWRGEDRLAKGFDKVAGRGWANRKLIGDECG
jgi:hypothetical protein